MRPCAEFASRFGSSVRVSWLRITSGPLALNLGFLRQVFRKNALGLPQQVPCHVTNAAQGQSMSLSSQGCSQSRTKSKTNSGGTQTIRCDGNLRYFDGYLLIPPLIVSCEVPRWVRDSKQA
jgi:hypothetical protein